MRLLTATILTGLLGSSPAFAQDCASPYTLDALLADLTAVESGLRAADDASAASAANRMREGMGCLNEIMPAMIAARAYRGVGAGLHVGGDADAAQKWFRTSLELDPVWIYGVNDVGVDHPVRLAFDALKTEDSPDAVELAGKAFPEESKNYLDGKKLGSPKARPDRFHVFQRAGEDTETWLIEGNAFPGDALIAAAAPEPTKEPKQKKDKKARAPKDKAPKEQKVGKQPKAKKAKPPKTKIGPNGEVIYKRRRPPEKTPLMIAGAVVMASAGAIYYAAYQQKRKFNAITTAADVNDGLDLDKPFDLCGANEDPSSGCVKDPNAEAKRIAGNANRLSLAALGVAAVGAAGLTWGIIVDGDSVTPTVNFRW